MNDNLAISEAESIVMQEIWHVADIRDQQVTSREIIGRLSESTDWTSGTIKTLLHRLVEKGILQFQRKGNRYLYRATISEDVYVDQMASRLLNTAFDGRPLPMIHYLVQSTRLSGSEIESLREMLLELRELPPAV